MRNKGTGLMFLGTVLILAAAALTVYNLAGSRRAQESAARAVESLKTETAQREPADERTSETQPDYLLFPNMQMPVTVVDGQEYVGTLQLPVLELELPVISEWSYEALKTAPCRYRGSAYGGGLILMAHNYESHFGRLRELRPGDAVSFSDVSGNRFCYRVADLEEIAGSDIEGMLAGQWDLTLFTCSYGGQNRVAVRCVSDS